MNNNDTNLNSFSVGQWSREGEEWKWNWTYENHDQLSGSWWKMSKITERPQTYYS